jgi:high-affinity iron transporter
MLTATAAEAGLILLREGLEALLILSALAAYLTRVGERRRIRGLAGGAALAVLASFAAAWVFQAFYGGAHNDMVEAVILAAAAVLLFYVSGWLFLRQDPRAWQGYLRQQVDRALAPAAGLPLAVIAFLAVFREGAETILFLHALAIGHGGWHADIVTGLLGAAVALAVIGYAVHRIALKLPLRPLFLATSGFLFYMGLKFTGTAVYEFQEVGLLPYDDAAGIGGLLDAIGFNPTLEALGIQLAIVALTVVSLAVARRRAAQAQAQAAAQVGTRNA